MPRSSVCSNLPVSFYGNREMEICLGASEKDICCVSVWCLTFTSKDEDVKGKCKRKAKLHQLQLPASSFQNEMIISCKDAMIQSFWFIFRDKLEQFLFRWIKILYVH